jgi:hypothetical protein
VGLGSPAVLAPAVPVAGVPASRPLKIRSAAAASADHSDVAAPAALDAVIFCKALTCFFNSSICVLALPVIASAEMSFSAASAFCKCSCGVPCPAAPCVAVIADGVWGAAVCAEPAAGTARNPATTIAAQVDVQRFMVFPSKFV